MSGPVEVVFTPWPYDAVARGVALLDEKVPGWRKRIALNRLRMADPLLCIAGQLDIWDSVTEPAHYGFDLPRVSDCFGVSGYSSGYALLDDTWREAIAGGAA